MSNVNKFNISSEKYIENRISAYKLTQKERASIWGIVKNRDIGIENQKNDHHKNFDQNLTNEFDDLKAKEKHELNFNKHSQLSSNASLQLKAYNNLINKHNAKLNSLNKNAQKDIDQILSHAREENRGPDFSLSREFNNSRERTR